jgi:hypothetical protein
VSESRYLTRCPLKFACLVQSRQTAPSPAIARGFVRPAPIDMAQDRGTTTEQGYGWDHQQIRAALIRDLVEGTPCDRCFEPMHRRQNLDAAHPHDRPRSLFATSKATHLEHRTCNIRAGNGTRPPPTQRLRTSRDW